MTERVHLFQYFKRQEEKNSVQITEEMYLKCCLDPDHAGDVITGFIEMHKQIQYMHIMYEGNCRERKRNNKNAAFSEVKKKDKAAIKKWRITEHKYVALEQDFQIWD